MGRIIFPLKKWSLWLKNGYSHCVQLHEGWREIYQWLLSQWLHRTFNVQRQLTPKNQLRSNAKESLWPLSSAYGLPRGNWLTTLGNRMPDSTDFGLIWQGCFHVHEHLRTWVIGDRGESDGETCWDWGLLESVFNERGLTAGCRCCWEEVCVVVIPVTKGEGQDGGFLPISCTLKIILTQLIWVMFNTCWLAKSSGSQTF